MKATLEFDLSKEYDSYHMACNAPEAYQKIRDAQSTCRKILEQPGLSGDVARALHLVMEDLT